LAQAHSTRAGGVITIAARLQQRGRSRSHVPRSHLDVRHLIHLRYDMLPTGAVPGRNCCDAFVDVGTSEAIQKLQLGMQACIGQWTEMQYQQLDQFCTNVEQLFQECTLSALHARPTEHNVRQEQLEESTVIGRVPSEPTMRTMRTKDIDDLVNVLGWTRPESGRSKKPEGMLGLLWFGVSLLCLPFSCVGPSARERFQVVLRHDIFELSVSVLICLNSIFIGMVEHQAAKAAFANYEARVRGEVSDSASPAWVRSCDLFFCIVFSIELLLRVVGEGGEFFMGADKTWNLLDFLTVASSIAQEFLRSVDLSFFRILRIVRTIRVLRVVRLIKVFFPLRLMLVAVVGAIVPLLWTFLFCLVVMYIFGIVIQQQVSDYISSLGGSPVADEDRLGHDAPMILSLQTLCPTLNMTMLSLFMSMTSGISWNDLWEPLRHISVFAGSVFTFYIGFMVLGVLNVVTGLFVQQAMKVAEADSDMLIRAEIDWKKSCFNSLKEIFQACDTDGSGKISFSEFQAQTKTLKVREMFQTLDLDVLEAEGLFKLLDLRGSGELGIDEFVIGCMRLKGNNRHVNLASLLYENKQAVSAISDLIGNIDRKINLIDRRGTLHQSSATRKALPATSPASFAVSM